MLLTQAGSKYVFGRAGEGLQRALAENKIRATKLENVFLSGPTRWSTVGGLPGFLLTAGDQGVKGISVHSANSDNAIGKMTTSWRHFVYHNKLDINVEQGSIYEDETLAIEPVPFNAGHSTSYIVQINPSRGKFLIDKARALGVPKGPMFRTLTMGQPVTLESGQVIQPSQVMDEPKTPPRVLIIDCPDMQTLADMKEFDWHKQILPQKRKRGSPSDTNVEPVTVDIKAVYHFLGNEVDPFSGEYLDFITTKFKEENDSCLHFIAHSLYTADDVTLRASAQFQHNLREHFPTLFNKLHTADAKLSPPPQSSIPYNYRLLHAMDVTVLEPEVKFHASEVGSASTTEGSQTMSDCKTIKDTLTINEPQVVTLGTGSAAPSKYRNVASTLVRFPNSPSVMFDCGEGTLGTIKRLYGPDETQQILRELGLLYISHLHADHHLGAISVINEWIKCNDSDNTKKLLVAAPPPYAAFLNEWAVIDNNLDLSRIEFVSLERCIVGRGYFDSDVADERTRLVEGDDQNSKAADVSADRRSRTVSPSRTRSRSRSRNHIRQSIGSSHSYYSNHTDKKFDFAPFSIKDLQVVRADHCKFAYCVSVTMPDGFKVSYSGDTRPSPEFADTIGQDSDILIHEATHEDELLQEAIAKRHSTIGEAIGTARRMSAKRTILTHFSQRYPKLPELGNLDLTNVALAFDGMRVNYSEIEKQVDNLPAFAEILKQMEGDDDDQANESQQQQN